MRQTIKTRGGAPANYATLMAEDRRLASELAHLTSVGAQDEADALIDRAAKAVKDQCGHMPVIDPSGHYSPLLQALRNIELVAKRSDQRSDEVQAWWCILLHQKLAGLE